MHAERGEFSTVQPSKVRIPGNSECNHNVQITKYYQQVDYDQLELAA